MSARVVASVLLSLALACARREPDRDPAPSRAGVGASASAPPVGVAAAAPAAAPSAHAVLGAGDTVAGASIYALETRVKDQDGASIRLDVFRGKPVLISMFYASCPMACPTLVSHLKQIEAALPPEVKQEVRVLLVSFDAAHDTVDVLRTLAAKHKVDASRWRFAVAGEDASLEVAAVLGIKFRAADGQFNHSSVITVLDQEGKIVLRADGMGDSTEVVASRLRELHGARPATRAP